MFHFKGFSGSIDKAVSRIQLPPPPPFLKINQLAIMSLQLSPVMIAKVEAFVSSSR
jgi:hypothetical protein